LFNYIFSDEEIYEVFTNVSHIEDWDIFFEKIIIFLIERTKKTWM